MSDISTLRAPMPSAESGSTAHLIVPPYEPKARPLPIGLAPPAGPTPSAASLVAPQATDEVDPKKAERAILFAEIRELLKTCPPAANLHDRVTIVIAALISQGVNTKAAIVSAAYHLGFNGGHAAGTLKRLTGNEPVRHSWKMAPDGTFVLLD